MKSIEKYDRTAAESNNIEVPGKREMGEPVSEYAGRRADEIGTAYRAELDDWSRRETEFADETMKQIGLSGAQYQDARAEFGFDQQVGDVRGKLGRVTDFVRGKIKSFKNMLRGNGAKEQTVDFSQHQEEAWMKEEEPPISASFEANNGTEQRENKETKEGIIDRSRQKRAVAFALDMAHKWKAINEKVSEKIQKIALELPVIGSTVGYGLDLHHAMYGGKDLRIGRKHTGRERLVLLAKGATGLAMEFGGGQEIKGVKEASNITKVVAGAARIFESRAGGEKSKGKQTLEAVARWMVKNDRVVQDVENAFQES